MDRVSQLLVLVAGSFTTALLIAVYLESQFAAVAAWYLLFALAIVSFIWLVVFAVRNAHTHLLGDSRTDSTSYKEKSSEDHTQDGLAILRERYACGELTDEQFERKLDRLLKTDTPENAAEWREEIRE